MKRPSFQFYPADWRNNAKLRRCSYGARGAWMDVLGLLHDSDEYGVLRWPLKDIVIASGAPVNLIKELVDKGVLKGADKGAEPYIYTPRHAGMNGEPVRLVEPKDGPCWYCSRFVRDEWVRNRRGLSTRFDSDNRQPKKPPKPPPKPTIGDGAGGESGDGPTASSSSSYIPPSPPRKRRGVEAEVRKPNTEPQGPAPGVDETARYLAEQRARDEAVAAQAAARGSAVPDVIKQVSARMRAA